MRSNVAGRKTLINRRYEIARRRADLLDAAHPRARRRPWRAVLLVMIFHFSREAFVQAVLRIKEYILAGDAFQVLLARRMHTPLDFEPTEYQP